MESKSYPVEERSAAFKQIMPATELKSNENMQEAFAILITAAKSFEKAGVKSEISKVIEEIKAGKVAMNVSFGVQYV